MLHESQLTILVQVLVDPAAYDDFIDSNFIELYVILSLLTPIALGIPWLELRNPHIYWSTASIRGLSKYCHVLSSQIHVKK